VPHVVVLGAIDLGRVARAWEPLLERHDRLIVRTGELFLTPDSRRLLVETTAVEDGLTQRFFVRVTARDGGVMVRLEPLTDPPIKGAAVKTALASIARRLRERFGGTGFGVTNLGSFLGDEEDRGDGGGTGDAGGADAPGGAIPRG
jgi:hypothetical protein